MLGDGVWFLRGRRHSDQLTIQTTPPGGLFLFARVLASDKQPGVSVVLTMVSPRERERLSRADPRCLGLYASGTRHMPMTGAHPGSITRCP